MKIKISDNVQRIIAIIIICTLYSIATQKLVRIYIFISIIAITSILLIRNKKVTELIIPIYVVLVFFLTAALLTDKMKGIVGVFIILAGLGIWQFLQNNKIPLELIGLFLTYVAIVHTVAISAPEITSIEELETTFGEYSNESFTATRFKIEIKKSLLNMNCAVVKLAHPVENVGPTYSETGYTFQLNSEGHIEICQIDNNIPSLSKITMFASISKQPPLNIYVNEVNFSLDGRDEFTDIFNPTSYSVRVMQGDFLTIKKNELATNINLSCFQKKYQLLIYENNKTSLHNAYNLNENETHIFIPWKMTTIINPYEQFRIIGYIDNERNNCSILM